MVNFDLPCDPMLIEQRLGASSASARSTTEVTNLLRWGTIEDRILRVLESRINRFELVVGVSHDPRPGRRHLIWFKSVFVRHPRPSRDDDES